MAIKHTDANGALSWFLNGAIPFNQSLRSLHVIELSVQFIISWWADWNLTKCANLGHVFNHHSNNLIEVLGKNVEHEEERTEDSLHMYKCNLHRNFNQTEKLQKSHALPSGSWFLQTFIGSWTNIDLANGSSSMLKTKYPRVFAIIRAAIRYTYNMHANLPEIPVNAWNYTFIKIWKIYRAHIFHANEMSDYATETKRETANERDLFHIFRWDFSKNFQLANIKIRSIHSKLSAFSHSELVCELLLLP